MARADDLQKLTLKDFTGGLWERGNDREVPANGLLELTDAMALPTGGLRAAMAFTTIQSEGLSTAGRIVTGFYASPKTDYPGGRKRLYLVEETSPASTGGTSGAARLLTAGCLPGQTTFTTWALVRSHSTVSTALAHNPVPFTFYATSVAIGANISAKDFYTIPDVPVTQAGGGVFAIADAAADGTTSKLVTTAGFTMFVELKSHQDRLFGAQIGSSAFVAGLQYTNPGGTTFASFQAIGPYLPGHIASVHPSYPSDLVVLREPRGIFSVQGTFPSVFVREAGVQVAMGQRAWGASTPYGTVVPTADRGIWMYTGGISGQLISPQFTGTPMVPSTGFFSANTDGYSSAAFLGQVAYSNDWLFTPNGYVYDFRTRSWFKVSLPNGASLPFWQDDAANSRVFAAGTVSSAGQPIVASVADETMARAQSYVFTTPLQFVDDHAITLREVVLHVEAYGPSQIQLDVVYRDPNGSYVTASMPPQGLGAGSCQVRILVGQQGGGSITTQAFKVRPTIQSLQVGVEAPTLEKLVVGYVAADARIP